MEWRRPTGGSEPRAGELPGSSRPLQGELRRSLKLQGLHWCCILAFMTNKNEIHLLNRGGSGFDSRIKISQVEVVHVAVLAPPTCYKLISSDGGLSTIKIFIQSISQVLFFFFYCDFAETRLGLESSSEPGGRAERRRAALLPGGPTLTVAEQQKKRPQVHCGSQGFVGFSVRFCATSSPTHPSLPAGPPPL